MLKKLFFLIIPFILAFTSGEKSCFAGGYNLPAPDPSEFRQGRDQLAELGSRIYSLSLSMDTLKLKMIADSLQRSAIRMDDRAASADIWYFAGICDYFRAKYSKALENFVKCIDLKQQLGIIDNRLANALFNAGLACSHQGDYFREISYIKQYLEYALNLYSENSGEVAEAYSALAGASIQCLDMDSFVDYSFRALAVLNKNRDALDVNKLSSLYNTVGVGHALMGDFAKARFYLEKAETLIRENNIPPDENYINLINSLAVTYGSLGISDKESVYFSRGIDLAVGNNSSLAFNLINNYASELARLGDVKKGERLLSDVTENAREVYGSGSRLYTEVLKNYAGYLVDYTEDDQKALSLYDKLFLYLENHPDDKVMKSQVYSGYAKLLHQTGENPEALVVIRDLLFGEKPDSPAALLFENPSIDSLVVNLSTLRIMQLKYDIVRSLYSARRDQNLLRASAATAELIISMIERIRLNISEEESRIVLGDKYRDSYLHAIRDFELCYRITGDRGLLDKAFMYAEKSKMAGLLAATRQFKAVQFNIPQPLAERENNLQREIGFYNSRIALENGREKPDLALLSRWNERLVAAVESRDSLVLAFEKDYPGYFALKYNTNVPDVKEIRSIIGKNYNYINYVITDTALYIFLLNRKFQEIITIPTDSSFIMKLTEFRNLLSDPAQYERARTKFNRYQQIGSDLYRTLVEPAEKYLVSDNLLISPDNVLSYLPFETFIKSFYNGNDILYRKLDYLMNEYNISYAYSATLMSENIPAKSLHGKRLAAFAPSYPESMNMDSVLAERQMGNVLFDLPFARQEAEYVTGISRGTLYLNDKATEDVFKSEAGKYSIIHLAMHAVVNDQNPMNSAMIFTPARDSVNDGLLRTYEVYGIPLTSRMVVLSSCNTGSGRLTSGEGILSLARGFLYSGSQSVVMSLWKIEDRSGTEIIKMFYDNLKKGMTKSKALRIARRNYLRNSNQLRSHPYFWSALVIFGDNSPVWFSWKPAAGSLLLLSVIGGLLVNYFRKRRYS